MSKEYFILANQYLETSKLLLKELIENDNLTCGIGSTEKEAYDKMMENSLKSDTTLFIPMLFNCHQAMELFVKGLLLLNNVYVQETHEVSLLISDLKIIYGEKSDTYKTINRFYKNQINIINNFKTTNAITTTKELYESLRYPEKGGKKYDYYDLKYNGDIGISQFKLLLKRINEVQGTILKEYHQKCN